MDHTNVLPPDEPVLHPVEDFISWIEEDLHSFHDNPKEYTAKQDVIRAFLKDFSFRETYEKLSKDQDFFECGEVKGARHRIKQSLLSLDYIVTMSPDAEKKNPLVRAASLARAALDFYLEEQSGKLEPDVFRGKTLNMVQYGNLVGPTLVPVTGGNHLHLADKSQHAAVMTRGYIYKIQVMDGTEPLSPEKILWQLQEVDKATQQKGEKETPGLGVITSCSRSKCAQLRNEINRNEVNNRCLSMIDDALFVIALDPHLRPEGLDEIGATLFSANYQNRWYDKSYNLVVMGNGEAGGLFNYACYLDGSIGIRFTAEVQKHGAAMTVGEPSSDGLETPREYPYEVSPGLLREADSEARQYVRSTQSAFVFEGISKDFFKSRKISPDSSIQMAILLGARRYFGRSLSLRQFVSVRKYRGGTLDCPYATTQAVEKFLDAACHRETPKPELAELMRKAVQSHKDIILKTVSGRSPKVVFNRCLVDATPEQVEFLRQRVDHYKSLGFKKYVGDIFGLDKDTGEIITSALGLKPETPLCGRPGVRLPYLTHFGLHYFVLPDSILFIYMPAPYCPDDVSELHKAVQGGLEEVREILLSEG
ncbi:MAG: choline/carnitine O-acyltransferase [Acidobacteriota bacterium]|nr:choline/carnitine O-acyltransferase [Acidobacteriota bacterium]